MSAKFYTEGRAGLASSISEIEAIAQQCPYKGGGHAVYKARAILKYFNDITVYDDRSTCSLQGYNREAASGKIKNTLALIKPNPAKELITLLYPFEIKAKTEFIITDALSRTLFTAVLPEGKQETEFNVSHLSNGFYMFRIINDKETLAHGKFVISR